MEFPTVWHKLSCINRGLVISRHNKVCDGILYLYQWFFPPTCVHGEPASRKAAADQRRRHVREGATLRQEVMSSSKSYGKYSMKPSLTSYLTTSMIQWISSYLVDIRKIKMIPVSTATRNGDTFLHFYSQWMARSGRRLWLYSRIWVDLWWKTRGTHFTRAWMGHRPDRHHGHEVVLPHDLRSSSSQSPAGLGAGLVFGIEPQIGAISCAPEYPRLHTRAKLFAANVPLPSLLVHALRARRHWLRTGDSIWGPPVCVTGTVEAKKREIGIKGRYFGVQIRDSGVKIGGFGI